MHWQNVTAKHILFKNRPLKTKISVLYLLRAFKCLSLRPELTAPDKLTSTMFLKTPQQKNAIDHCKNKK